MVSNLSFPYEQLDREEPNLDLLADFFELYAYFSSEKISIPDNFGDKFQILQDDEDRDIGAKLDSEDGPLDEVVRKIADRSNDLENAYPFVIDATNTTLRYRKEDLSYGKCAYILSLVLSNMYGKSGILKDSDLKPTKSEEVYLRRYFEYFSTAAMAVEINGHSWIFASPRPDRTKFLEKLKRVCNFLGLIYDRSCYAPKNQKDSGIDVLSARPYRDNLPGFIYAIAQVSTGQDWKSKGVIRESEFLNFWTSRDVPVVSPLIYHIIPFARSKHELFRDCTRFERILHRTRLPLLVEKATYLNRTSEIKSLYDSGVLVEAYEELSEAADWVREYSRRGFEI